jgi:hypothetical protein
MSPHAPFFLRRWRQPLIVILLIIMWVLPGLGGFMHESDQASLLDGGWQLSGGEGWKVGADFYDYDKLFVSYWLLAGVFWVARHIVAAPDVVWLGNVFSSGLLLCGLLAALRRAGLSSQNWMALIAVTLAPAFLMHAPFFAAAFVSAGILMGLYSVLRQPAPARPIGRGAVATLLTFAAVGARADAILVLPFLVWLTRCPMPRPWLVFRRPLLYWMIAAAAAALAIGKCLQPDNGVYGFPPLVRGKVFAAYVVFGLGGAVFVIGWLAVQTIGGAFTARGLWRRLSWAFGGLSFAAPFVYYAGQLFSTRYWTTALTATVLFVISRRGRALLQKRGASRAGRWVTAAALVAAVLPLFIGVRLPFPTKPRLVMRNATFFPSTDGMIPMGSYLAFHFWPGNAENLWIPDHNEAIWLAARRARFENDETGAVPLLETPMVEILKLAVNVQGKKFRIVDQLDQKCYSDLRSLIKVAPNSPSQWRASSDPTSQLEDSVGAFLNGVSAYPVSAFFRGIAIFRLARKTTGQELDPLDASRLLRKIYRGNDFRVRDSGEVISPDGSLRLAIREGRTLVIAADKPFGIRLRAQDGKEKVISSRPFDGQPEMNVVILNGEEANIASVRFDASQPIPQTPIFGEAILPNYMSVQAFKE